MHPFQEELRRLAGLDEAAGPSFTQAQSAARVALQGPRGRSEDLEVVNRTPLFESAALRRDLKKVVMSRAEDKMFDVADDEELEGNEELGLNKFASFEISSMLDTLTHGGLDDLEDEVPGLKRLTKKHKADEDDITDALISIQRGLR